MNRQEEKDAELDRRIVALRKKNQALLRRYQVSGLCQGLGGPLGWHSLSDLHPLCGGLSLKAQAGDDPSQRLRRVLVGHCLLVSLRCRSVGLLSVSLCFWGLC